MMTLSPAAHRDDLENPVEMSSDVPADESRSTSASTVPTWSGTGELVRAAVAALAVLALALTAQITVVSGLQHQSAQSRAFAKLRSDLAQGVAPVSALDRTKHLLSLGTPMALLEIKSIGLREVVGEGTTPGVLTSGPGHRRDSAFPGQLGRSEIYGRRASYGGPFKRLNKLKAGTKIMVTTGQGVSTYKVARVRRAGDPIPALPPTGSLLTLATASGSAYVPSGVLWVDANLVGTAQPTAARAIRNGSVPSGEKPMGNDATTLWALVLWLQALIVLAVGAVWSWLRWGRHQTWIVFGPLAAAVGLAAAGQVTRLLPNLL
jgi:sortase A